MTYQEFYDELDFIDHSREKRTHYAQLIMARPELMPYAFDVLFMVDDERSTRAGWMLEFAVRKKIALIYPHLDYFTDHIHAVYKDSAVRPVAKICECLSLSYGEEQHTLTRKYLTPRHCTKIIEAGFDWLITNQKVAVKAYTMTTLFYLGKETDWVHSELERIMDEGYYYGSAAFKARVRHTKEALRKYRKQQNL